MTPATRRQHRRCRFYLAEWCHLYLAPTRYLFDNICYVKNISFLLTFLLPRLQGK